MAFTNPQHNQGGWSLTTRIEENERIQLLAELSEQYRAETCDAAQFAAHAERMYYPQFRDRLATIAVEEQAHANWLRDQILALGGEAPEVSVNPDIGKNSWECLSLDVEREKRSCAELRHCVGLAMHVDANLAEGLLRLCDEEQRHHEELREMWMKSEPGVPAIPQTAHPELAQQKRSWFEQQKSEWFARQLAEWEAKGKPSPWAEWEGELENDWVVNKLPNLELHWSRLVAEEEIADVKKEVEHASRRE